MEQNCWPGSLCLFFILWHTRVPWLRSMVVDTVEIVKQNWLLESFFFFLILLEYS